METISSLPLLTMVYSPTAVVSIAPAQGTVWPGAPNKAVTGTQAQFDALIARLKLTPLAAGATSAPTPQQGFAAAVAAGFTYTVPGRSPAVTLTLDLRDGARAQFTGLMVLLNAMMQEGQILATSNQAIADKAGTLHQLTVAQIQAMLLAYGAFYAGLFNTLHAATTAAVAPASAPAA